MRYSPSQVDEFKRQANYEHEARINAMRTEMQTALSTANADTSRLRQELLETSTGSVTTAIEVDPANVSRRRSSRHSG